MLTSGLLWGLGIRTIRRAAGPPTILDATQAFRAGHYAPMSEMTEEDAEQKIRETFDQVVTWHRTPLFEPNVGAELRADDDEWPYLAASQLAKAGLDVAAEHLFTIKTLVEAGEILPMAYRSILRTATVGATQCVWLLASSDQVERSRRLRVLAAEMYRRHGQYLNDLLILNDIQGAPRDENTEAVLEHVTKRATQMGTVRTFAEEKATWNDTDAITTAAHAVWGNDAKADELVQNALLEWRAGSGVSHGLVWPLFGSAGTRSVGPVDEHGRVVIEARGSYLRVVNGYLLAYWMTAAGWKLLRRRGL